jgi:hypothetical protein
MTRIAKIVQSIDTPSNRNSMRQPPKGEKRHLRAELSLERRIYDAAVREIHPAVLDARLAPRKHGSEKIFLSKFS